MSGEILNVNNFFWKLLQDDHNINPKPYIKNIFANMGYDNNISLEEVNQDFGNNNREAMKVPVKEIEQFVRSKRYRTIAEQEDKKHFFGDIYHAHPKEFELIEGDKGVIKRILRVIKAKRNAKNYWMPIILDANMTSNDMESIPTPQELETTQNNRGQESSAHQSINHQNQTTRNQQIIDRQNPRYKQDFRLLKKLLANATYPSDCILDKKKFNIQIYKENDSVYAEIKCQVPMCRHGTVLTKKKEGFCVTNVRRHYYTKHSKENISKRKSS